MAVIESNKRVAAVATASFRSSIRGIGGRSQVRGTHRKRSWAIVGVVFLQARDEK